MRSTFFVWTLVSSLSCATTAPSPRSDSVERGAGPPKSAPARPTAADDRPPEVANTRSVEQLTRVVAAAAPRLKKYCWQPWLDARAPGAKTTVRIVLRLELDRFGKVTALQATESPDGFPGLAECVATLVRDLSFGEAAMTSSVNVPFVFDARKPAD